jgi:hypothetical protein
VELTGQFLSGHYAQWHTACCWWCCVSSSADQNPVLDSLAVCVFFSPSFLDLNKNGWIRYKFRSPLFRHHASTKTLLSRPLIIVVSVHGTSYIYLSIYLNKKLKTVMGSAFMFCIEQAACFRATCHTASFLAVALFPHEFPLLCVFLFSYC